jgi:hypothetical protein
MTFKSHIINKLLVITKAMIKSFDSHESLISINLFSTRNYRIRMYCLMRLIIEKYILSYDYN